MSFLQKLLQGIAFVPAVVNGIEGLFGTRSGQEKKESAVSFVSAALQLGETVTNREIVDEEKFKAGLSKGDRRYGRLPECVRLGAREQAVTEAEIHMRGNLMSVGFMKKSLLVVFLTLSVAAFAKPAHLLYHTGKGIAYPVRHPAKTTHGLWKLVKAVF